MPPRTNAEPETTLAPGAFIPYRVLRDAKRRRQQWEKRAMGAAAVALLTVMIGGYNAIGPRLSTQSVVASVPTVILQNTGTYTSAVLSEGPTDALGEQAAFDRTVAAFLTATTSLLAVDLPERSLTLYLKGQEVLTADIIAEPSAASWRYTPSGIYQLSGRSPRQYSAVQAAYYPYAIQFSRNFLVHGRPETANGRLEREAETGITLATNDAKSLFELAPEAMTVIVRNAAAPVEPAAYTHTGPQIGQGRYLVADTKTGAAIVSRGATDAAVPVASLTKLMTALVVAESYDLDGEVLVEQEVYVDSLVPRLGGIWRTTYYNLLQLLLEESSNEAAEVLAAATGREQFIARMNARARELGLTQTTFADPSGLNAGNVSSLRDLSALATYLYEHHRFLWLLSVSEPTVAAKRPDDFVALENFNLIDDLSDMVGGKIGETSAAAQTSVSLHKMQFGGKERIVTIVLLGSEDRSHDVTAIHEYVAERFE